MMLLLHDFIFPFYKVIFACRFYLNSSLHWPRAYSSRSMMFQQSRQMHTIEPMDFLTHQKMSERMLSPAFKNMDAAQAAKRQRVEANSQGPNYDHLPVNFFPVDTTVVVSKAEYELMRQEVVNLKQTLNEFRSSVEAELEQLKKENKLLKSQVARCTCGCRTRPANQNQTNDKSSEDDSNLQTSFGTI